MYMHVPFLISSYMFSPTHFITHSISNLSSSPGGQVAMLLLQAQITALFISQACQFNNLSTYIPGHMHLFLKLIILARQD